jgi:hypothetical protein
MSQVSIAKYPKKLSYAEKKNIAVNTILNECYWFDSDHISCQIEDIHIYTKCKSKCSVYELVSLWFSNFSADIAA